MKTVKSIAVICAVAVLAVSCGTVAKQTAASQSSPVKVVAEHIPSTILDSVMNANIIVPQSFYDNPDQTYPVLYLLHGLSDDHTTWLEHGKAAQVLAEQLAAGNCCEMIIVCPQAGCSDYHKYHAGYFNVEGWSYEDYFFNELIPYIEAKYRIRSEKGSRAIAGLSMGGGGTAAYAQHHPELFSSAYPMSAWMYNGGLIEKAGDYLDLTVESVDANNTVEFVSKADEATLEALRSVFWVVECGDDDFLFWKNIEFYYAMQTRHVPCELIIRDGVHSWDFWNVALYNTLKVATEHFDK